MRADRTSPDPDRVARRARPAVAALLVALCLAAYLDAEWWPISAMRLFSGPRTGETVAFEVRGIDASGRSHLLPVRSLGIEFVGAHHLIPRMRSWSDAERDEVCGAWADAAAEAGHPVAEVVEVDRVVRRVATSDGGPRPELRRETIFTCRGAT